MIDSLAWPVTVCVAIYFLRKPIVELLPNLRQLIYKDLKIEFGQKLEKLEEELEQQPPLTPSPTPSGQESITDERFNLFVEISPSAAVLDAWIDVERRLRALAVRQNINERRGSSVLYITRVLRSQEVISPRLAGLLDDLRNLRNLAAHPTGERQISPIEARRYKEIVDQVGDELHSLLE